MTSKERVKVTLTHKATDRVAVDFGGTPVTGIHVLAIERLREFYGLEKKPVQVIEPYQMLGQIDDELAGIIGIDTIGISPRNDMFGIPHAGEYKEFQTFWGQVVLFPVNFNTKIDSRGDLLIYPGGDVNATPSGKMPKTGYFFNAIIRQDPIVEETLDPADNLEEFGLLTDVDLRYWQNEIEKVKDKGKAVVANFGGTGFGDIALVPGLNLKKPRGIRDVAEWYMSVIMRPDYIREIFEKQSNIAIQNLSRLSPLVGDDVDVAYICGTDFGTQDSQFCSLETLNELYTPYYQQINNWIHQHTSWKTFKHSCGAVEPFIDSFIEAGFDILNPVQVNAKGMDPGHLKGKYGDRIVFWGGGVDTQRMLPFGTPGEVRNQVENHCRIFSKNGGFVFNTIHNIQANVPVENIAAMIDSYQKFKP